MGKNLDSGPGFCPPWADKLYSSLSLIRRGLVALGLISGISEQAFDVLRCHMLSIQGWVTVITAEGHR